VTLLAERGLLSDAPGLRPAARAGATSETDAFVADADRGGARVIAERLACCGAARPGGGCGGTKTVTDVTNGHGRQHVEAGRGCPAESVQFGYLKSLEKKGSDYELRFDPAFFLSGETANAAAAEDGAVEPGQPVPNDYYVVDEGHRLLTYRVPTDAKLTVVALGPKNIPTTVEALAKMVAGEQTAPWMPISSGFWLRARIDTVVSLDQQYRP
jgi:hypothetical protein